MIVTTTTTLEGRPIKEYVGIVSGETIIGANAVRDFLANVRDFVGGRSGSYERVLAKARETSLNEMRQRAEDCGANAIVGVSFDYEAIGSSGSMLMVNCNGTAVII